MPSLQILTDNPETVNDASPTVPTGTLRGYIHPTYGYQTLKYVQFKDAIAYVRYGALGWSAADGGLAVTNDVSEDNGIAAGVGMGVVTQNYYSWMVVQGRYLVKTNGDDDIADGDVIIIASDGGLANSGSDPGVVTRIGFALAADVDADDTVLTLVNVPY